MLYIHDQVFANHVNEYTFVGQIQLQVEYGSQHGQLQVTVMEINSLILPTGKTKSHQSFFMARIKKISR